MLESGEQGTFSLSFPLGFSPRAPSLVSVIQYQIVLIEAKPTMGHIKLLLVHSQGCHCSTRFDLIV